MKNIMIILLCAFLLIGLCGCNQTSDAQIAATTLPVYQFTSAICENTPIAVERLVTESISCLHDYTLTVPQMKAIEQAQTVVISGAGLEDFMKEALSGAKQTIDASAEIKLMPLQHHHHSSENDHHHENDPHIWLSPINAISMSKTIYNQLCRLYPEYETTFRANLDSLIEKLTELDNYGHSQLDSLSNREMITFHDGFGYLAQAYGLTILHSIEEESGSEASADELTELIQLVSDHHIPAIFTELNGSNAAASVIAAETGVSVYSLDMAMSGDDYFSSMYHNIDTLKEALGS